MFKCSSFFHIGLSFREWFWLLVHSQGIEQSSKAGPNWGGERLKLQDFLANRNHKMHIPAWIFQWVLNGR